ncbi:hypothetical protein K432DRAFT_169618 [Lepidopterella palustris CBS 459.81]|uniref:Uncharacterized protein n=1 Tax=Lepidopterella palustris CBS 459.81 TaxID=1314670 RepID=A0A8E2EH57_9PEZI|nr:hypothetical protein K432DRAFT_169618 [Lepidopterella palustris CBS 459.81]
MGEGYSGIAGILEWIVAFTVTSYLRLSLDMLVYLRRVSMRRNEKHCYRGVEPNGSGEFMLQMASGGLPVHPLCQIQVYIQVDRMAQSLYPSQPTLSSAPKIGTATEVDSSDCS